MIGNGMWLVDSSACASDSDQPVHTWSQAMESEEKGNVLIFAILIPSSLQLQFHFHLVIHTGTKGSFRFHFQFQIDFNILQLIGFCWLEIQWAVIFTSQILNVLSFFRVV